MEVIHVGRIDFRHPYHSKKRKTFRKDSVKFDKIYVEDALVVPKNALKSDKKGQYLNVYINGFSSKRYVVVGGADSMNYWIVFGVEEGDTIIPE